MNALLNGEIDVAEAMTYNEYAQVLEAVNPDTGELYQPEDLNVIDFNEVGTAMLQDAVWAESSWLAEQRGRGGAVPPGLVPGLGVLPGQLRRLRRHRPRPRHHPRGRATSAWQLNEINALIWPATNGIGVMNQELWDQTVEVATSQIPELQGVEIAGRGVPHRPGGGGGGGARSRGPRGHRRGVREDRGRADRGRFLRPAPWRWIGSWWARCAGAHRADRPASVRREITERRSGHGQRVARRHRADRLDRRRRLDDREAREVRRGRRQPGGPGDVLPGVVLRPVLLPGPGRRALLAGRADPRRSHHASG